MQQTTAVAVPATHLAQTDRRALSQAWYSALHLATGVPRARAPVTRTARCESSSARRLAGNGAASHAGTVAAKTPGGGRSGPARERSAPRATASGETAAALAQRRGPKNAAAPHAERGLARRSQHDSPGDLSAGTASFAVRAANGRVHLVVRTAGGTTRVVAVCVPALRERVERALAQARIALTGAGMRARVNAGSAPARCVARAEAAR
jgi:hypothetical protein